MKHTFDVNIAIRYGVAEAILLENLFYWAKKNAANEKHFHDGRYWTYNSRKAFNKLFPYIGEKSIERSLNHLVESGILLKGNYNADKFDKTTWFAFTDLGESLMAETVDFVDTDNLSTSTGQNVQSTGQNDQPIPYINNTDITPKENLNPYGLSQKKSANRFTPPTVEDVSAYVHEKGYKVDPERFIDYYTATGWMYGKTKMKDWKAAVRNWNRNQKPTADEQKQAKEAEDLDKYARWEKEYYDKRRISPHQEQGWIIALGIDLLV